jgi:hypothetical protein
MTLGLWLICGGLLLLAFVIVGFAYLAGASRR